MIIKTVIINNQQYKRRLKKTSFDNVKQEVKEKRLSSIIIISLSQ